MKPFDTYNLPIICLSPGELYIADRPSIISTLLGSCISICLYTEFFKVGAMCHCLLPHSFASPKSMEQPFNYVDLAIKYMLLEMDKRNISKEKFFSKVFGGANMFKDIYSSKRAIGEQNIEAAGNILRSYQIPIEKESIGGYGGRKIFFHTGTGEVLVKKIPLTSYQNKKEAEFQLNSECEADSEQRLKDSRWSFSS